MMEFEMFEALAPILVLKSDIEEHTMRRPSALMLPLSLLRGAEEVYGMPVIRGDRVGLVFEA